MVSNLGAFSDVGIPQLMPENDLISPYSILLNLIFLKFCQAEISEAIYVKYMCIKNMWLPILKGLKEKKVFKH